MIRKFIVLGLSLSLLISCVGCTMSNKTAEDTGSNAGNTGIATSEAAEAETISDVSEVEDVNRKCRLFLLQ